MDKENARNTIVFVVCAVALMIAYQMFILGPRAKEREVAARAQAALAAKNPIAAAAPGAQIFVDRAQAVAASPRVLVENPAVKGSIALQGGRIDDLFLKDYKQTLTANSPPVELFRPEGAKQAYFADFGWTGQAVAPSSKTLWTQTAGATLAPGQPVTLTWDNGQGLTFTRQIALDERYMFTVVDTVANRGTVPVQLAPYASVQRQGLPSDMSATNILHEGAIGYFAGQLRMIGFKKWTKGGLAETASTGGWLGVTDKYWLAAVIPDQKEAIQAAYRVSQVNGVDVYEANFVGPARAVAPGTQSVQTTRVFAGAKKVSVLKDYEDQLGVPKFDNAVDWGNFWFLTRPIFWLLEQFHKAAGNFGLSILMLTVFVRGLFFPLANKSYESVTKMKKVQPQLDELKKKFGSDPAKQQQEMMALYSREKINPLAGCVPILFQLPVFYALYKVLFVTIEMRHAPFVGWVHDLSAADPTTLWNLFGLIPYDPGALPLVGSMLVGLGFLHIGLWPIIYGITMWLSTSMSPMPTADPTQKIIFQLFPIVFTVMLAHSPVGLVIYWSWSSILTVLQQYVIMRRYKVDNPIDDIIRRLKGGGKKA